MIDDIGNCFICGSSISIAEAGRDEEIVYDENENPIHKICALAAIRELEKRTAIMKEPGPTIQISSNGLEPELEKVLFNIIERSQIRASEEGFRELMDYDLFENYNEEKYKGSHNCHLWLRVAPDYKCWICGYKTGNNLSNWYCDGNGNIVHERCFKND